MTEMTFNNRVVLVTGAASGIGKEIATGFAGRGASVVVADRNLNGAREVVEQIEGAGGAACAVFVDVADSYACEMAVQLARQRYGALDVLVNNAAYGLFKDIQDTADDEWDQVQRCILGGTFYMCRAALKVMRDHEDARIVNMSSAAGVRGLSKRGVYGAAKGGVVTLTKALAIEVGARGITVNAIAPGPIETPLVAGHTEQTRKSWLRLLAIERYGRPDEVAAAAYFLASPEAGYITGQTINVDGGFSAGASLERDG